MRADEAKYEQLTAYLDGELDAAQRAAVERLLERDAEARRVLSELRQAATAVAALPRVGAPAHLSDVLQARLEREALLGNRAVEPEAVGGSVWLRGLAIAAGFAIVVSASWLMWPALPKAGEQTHPEMVAMAPEGDPFATHRSAARPIPPAAESPTGAVAKSSTPAALPARTARRAGLITDSEFDQNARSVRIEVQGDASTIASALEQTDFVAYEMLTSDGKMMIKHPLSNGVTITMARSKAVELVRKLRSESVRQGFALSIQTSQDHELEIHGGIGETSTSTVSGGRAQSQGADATKPDEQLVWVTIHIVGQDRQGKAAEIPTTRGASHE